MPQGPAAEAAPTIAGLATGAGGYRGLNDTRIRVRLPVPPRQKHVDA